LGGVKIEGAGVQELLHSALISSKGQNVVKEKNKNDFQISYLKTGCFTSPTLQLFPGPFGCGVVVRGA
jgi:hypothetical protein